VLLEWLVSGLSFTPLSECEKAVALALASVDVEPLVQRAIDEGLARTRGMV
jgi:hypothetical protein